MSGNQCAACGQWSGKGHRCPAPVGTTTLNYAGVKPARVIGDASPAVIANRVQRAQAALLADTARRMNEKVNEPLQWEYINDENDVELASIEEPYTVTLWHAKTPGGTTGLDIHDTGWEVGAAGFPSWTGEFDSPEAAKAYADQWAKGMRTAAKFRTGQEATAAAMGVVRFVDPQDLSIAGCKCDSPDEVQCGSCGITWCEYCDPAPSAMCHACNGRGYTTALL